MKYFQILLILITGQTVQVSVECITVNSTGSGSSNQTKLSQKLSILRAVNLTNNIELNERYRRLIPYMTFYLSTDYQQIPQNQAYTPVVQQVSPKILIQEPKYQNVPQYQSNRLSNYNMAPQNNVRYRLNYNTNQEANVQYQHKVEFTPFMHSNKLPGQFTPIQTPSNYIQKPYNTIQQVFNPQGHKVFHDDKHHPNQVRPQYHRTHHQQHLKQYQHTVQHPQPQVHQQQQHQVVPEYNGNYEQKYISYIPAQNSIEYKPANVMSYENDGYNGYNSQQGYQTIKTYDQNIATVSPIAKYNNQYGGFQPITVTTLAPVAVIPQGYTVAPSTQNYLSTTVAVNDNYAQNEQQYSNPKYAISQQNTVPEKYQTPTYDTDIQDAEEDVKQNQDELTESRNSLAQILKNLQESNTLPQTLTADNIDNSIKTLVHILNNLKQTHKNVEVSTQSPIDPYYPKPIPESPDGSHSDEKLKNISEEQEEDIKDLNAPQANFPGPTSGRPGVDYPNYSEIPETAFSCKSQRYKGFFGDPDTHCQVWHYCDLNGGQASFLCPNGTIFSQVALTCDWWFNVKCSSTAQLYVLNERLYKYILPFTPKFPEDYSGPLVDKYLAIKFREMEEKMKKQKKKNNPPAAQNVDVALDVDIPQEVQNTPSKDIESEKADVIEIKPNGEPHN